MKHPFQYIKTTRLGDVLFASVKNQLEVFDLKNGKKIGHWIDELDNQDTLKKQQEEKIKDLQSHSQDLGVAAEDAKEVYKKLRSSTTKLVKIPKIPVPGPGAPPIFNYIRLLKLSHDEKFLVLTTDSDKSVVVFELDYNNANILHQIKRESFPKRPCALSISNDNRVLIVGDKFGDVYHMEMVPLELSEGNKNPILGHVSMLSDVLHAQYDNKSFIITADRDEHIRISNYPKSYVIRDFLFGHKEFVSQLHIPEFDHTTLFSAGGDDFICVWKWFEGSLLCKIPLRSFVDPYLNKYHLPPARFLSDESPKEIAIVRMLTYMNPVSDKKLLIVLCENTRCILTFIIDDYFTIVHKESYEVANPIVDFALSASTGLLITSEESDHERIINFHKIDEENKLIHIENSFSETLGLSINSKDDLIPLYNVNSLRKRSEH